MSSVQHFYIGTVYEEGRKVSVMILLCFVVCEGSLSFRRFVVLFCCVVVARFELATYRLLLLFASLI